MEGTLAGLDLSIEDVSPITWSDLSEDALWLEDSVGPQPDGPFQTNASSSASSSDCVNCSCHT
jgi:hypothetical protein